MMAERSKNLILVVSHSIILRRTIIHHEMHLYETETSLSKQSSAEEPLLLTKTIKYWTLHIIS